MRPVRGRCKFADTNQGACGCNYHCRGFINGGGSVPLILVLFWTYFPVFVGISPAGFTAVDTEIYGRERPFGGGEWMGKRKE